MYAQQCLIASLFMCSFVGLFILYVHSCLCAHLDDLLLVVYVLASLCAYVFSCVLVGVFVRLIALLFMCCVVYLSICFVCDDVFFSVYSFICCCLFGYVIRY